jgi:hypothetical protein
MGSSLIEIGEATVEKKIIHVENGVEKPIKPGGWEHFKN